MKELGYGDGYQYAHDYEEKITNLVCLPESLQGHEYYLPAGLGEEKRMKERLQNIKFWKKEHAEEKEE